MKRVLLAAHDPGGARMLAAVVPELRERGYILSFAAAGPALKLWEDFLPISADSEWKQQDWLNVLEDVRPNSIISGTSYIVDFERALWQAAKGMNIPSLAAIDAWITLERRFVRTDTGEPSRPDHVAVIDAWCAQQLEQTGWVAESVHAVGQPHLELMANSLWASRKTRSQTDAKPLVAFFSETIKQDPDQNCYPGYDQFSVAKLLVQNLGEILSLRLCIKPHPLEGSEPWNAWLREQKLAPGQDVTIWSETFEALLRDADAVVGMTSMALLEASLAGIPVISLQPERIYDTNPQLSLIPGLALVTSSKDVKKSLLLLAEGMGDPAPRLKLPWEGCAKMMVDVLSNLMGAT